MYFNVSENTKPTLLFLDEIQAAPAAITALKFFSTQKHFEVIASGSLLGVHYNQVDSFPVGYVERLTLYPLTFKEFLVALDKGFIYNNIKEQYDKKIKVDPIVHKKSLEYFIKYIVIGGMPEVVKKYSENSDFDEVIALQKNIINDYKDDIAKYATSNEKVKAREVFDSIPFQLSKVNKKFQYSILRKGARSIEYYNSIQWLIDAGIVYKTNLLTNLEIPLKVYSKDDHFKIYLMDTGLLVSMLGKEAQRLLLMNDLGIAKGAIYENIIATILKYNNHELYYYERSSGLEIDFIIEKDAKVVALEVKTGENTKSRSLQTLLQDNLINYGIRLSRKNFNDGKIIKSFPLYFSEFI